MGCDIHAMVEYRLEPWAERDDDWARSLGWQVCGGEVYIERSYVLFGALAGVRNRDVPAIQTDRGLPEDVNSIFEAWVKDWADDAHNVGYVTLDELRGYIMTRHLDETPLIPEYTMAELERLATMLDGLPGPTECKRLLYFFDS